MANRKQRPEVNFYSLYEDNAYSGGTQDSIRLSEIEPRADQPRKQFDKEALESLAESIAAYGVLQPIIVRKNENGVGYQIIAGERRWRAAKLAGLSEIPAVVFDGDNLKAAKVALVENVQREDLNPVEEAFGYKMLMDSFGQTQEQIAKQVGKSRPAIANMLRLLELPEEVLALLQDGSLSAGHARALLGLEDENDKLTLAERIKEKDLSVRETEEAVKRLNALRHAPAGEEPVHPIIAAHMKELERRAMSSLGRKVRISRSSHKKVVEIAYDSDEDLEALLRGLCGEEIFSEEN